MPPQVLSSLDAEEALVAGMLLYADTRALLEVSDEDMFYDHLRPVLRAIRTLSGASKPVNVITIMYALESQLDSIAWKGDVGEVLIMDILTRHVANPAACSPVAMANIVHNYAERRRALQRAHEEGTRKYLETVGEVGRMPRVVRETTRWVE